MIKKIASNIHTEGIPVWEAKSGNAPKIIFSTNSVYKPTKAELSETRYYFKLPDLAKSFAKLKAIVDLRQHTDTNTILGMAIVGAIDAKRSADAIIALVRDSAHDNPAIVAEVIGMDLMKRVLAL